MFDEITRLKQDKKWLEEENAALKHTLNSLVGVHNDWLIIETPCYPCSLKVFKKDSTTVDNATWRYHETIEQAITTIERHTNDNVQRRETENGDRL